MTCPLCQSRPARRQCPALDRTICPVCCGTKRRTEIRCPDTCVYLTNAQSHPPVTVRRRQERDLAVLLPAMNGLAEPQQQLFLVTVALVARGAGDPLALDAASDADVAAAAAALAGTYETAAKGLIYEQSAGSAPAQRIAVEIRQAYDEFGRTNPSSFAVEAARILRRLETCIDEAHRAGFDSRRGFLDLALRVALSLGPSNPEGEAEEPKSSIIIP
jgi:hypothetical protein